MRGGYVHPYITILVKTLCGENSHHDNDPKDSAKVNTWHLRPALLLHLFFFEGEKTFAFKVKT